MYQIVTDGGQKYNSSDDTSIDVFSFLPDHFKTNEVKGGNEEKRSGFNRNKRSDDRPKFGKGRKPFKSFDPKKGIDFNNVPVHLFINKDVVAPETSNYEAKNSFADFNLHPKLFSNLRYKKITSPSPIQDQAIPVAMEGKDLIGIASTGTGKTVAFLLPIISRRVSDGLSKAVIITPTRELAFQVQNELTTLSRGLRIFSVATVGGSSMKRQIEELEKGVSVIIGTPGRLKDLIERGKIKMEDYNTVVLDEADRMLDMGFIDDMRSILSKSHKNKQTLFFSATFGEDEKILCREFMKDPVTITLKTRETAKSVAQDVIYVSGDEKKVDALSKILSKPLAKKVIIFREKKVDVDMLALKLSEMGIKAKALHGDMDNRDRSYTVRDFKNGQIQALIATDVAARGIDIPDVSLVINYDMPQTYETYVHRIGRTGRATNIGYALTFVPESYQA